MKGRTRWYPYRHLKGPPVRPVRPGVYQCLVLITSAQRRLISWDLEWDGVGFLVPIPMVVKYWRGMTRAEHERLSRG